MPFISPRKSKSARASIREGRANLPVEAYGLSLFSMTATVQANLCQHQRSLIGEVLKAGEIAVQTFLFLQINIEANKIEKWQFEVLSRRIVDVSEKRRGIFCLCRSIEFFQKALDAPRAIPAHNRGRNLVANRVTQDGWVTGGYSHAGAQTIQNRLYLLPAIEERNMLLPRQTNHHAPSTLLRQIQKPARRHRISPNRV